jgi:hypothetical protein
MNYSYLASKSLSLASQLGAFFDQLSNNNGFDVSCPSLFSIAKNTPLWIVHEKHNKQGEGEVVLTIFDFLQKYYDWLYCDESEGAQYFLSQKLLDLIDIETTRKEYYKRFVTTYANGVEDKVLYLPGSSQTYDSEKLIKFIKNISKNLYHKKTTIEGIKHFLRTLFPLFSESDFYIYYPKQNLLRLNGGKFNTDKFKFRDATGTYDETNHLGGGYLNGSVMQDSDWFQDYSYLLKTGIPLNEYEVSYKNMMHPAGLKVIFEKTIEDYPGVGETEIETLVCERPILGNYSMYQLGTTYNVKIGIGNYAGSTYSLYGLTFCENCDLAAPWGITYPSHVFPNWSGSITGYRFDDINISDFFNMCFVQGFTSPNAGLTCSEGCIS